MSLFLAVTMLEGSLATMGAATISHPFETVKTRLQLQGELQKRTAANRHYKGTLHGMYVVGRHEGIKALYKGFGAALGYQFVMNGLRLGLYDHLKAGIGTVLPEGTPTNLAAGTATGAMGALAASPFYMVKTRQQAQSSHIAVGEQHAYGGLVDGMRTIVRQQGVAGLWRGAHFGAVRTAVGSGAQLSSYDFVKRQVQRGTGWAPDESRLHFTSSLLASGFVAFIMNPFDVIITRVYTASKTREYTANFAASFLKIAKAEGVEGLFKGTGALWARVGPHTVCTFVFLERIRATRKELLPWLE